ncbi:ABC transporter permease [Streptomyces sp. NBC_00440]|uniref:ABC transporter permease n=1 Tax=unclassified Streptomyces TaxID=2593676 RepID=UPI002E1C71D7|nr:ABC transporter permease [Streptomyces sp. NBC_00932]
MTECTAEENPSAAPSAAAGTPPAPAAAPRRHRFSGRWRPLRRRLGFYLVAAWAAITANFLIPRLMPGDPAEVILRQFQKTSGGEPLPPGAIDNIRALFGDPKANLFQQYADYLGNLAHLNLGVSVSRFPVPVSDLIMTGLPWTLMLAGISTVLAFVIGIVLGVVAGWRPGRLADSVMAPLAMFTTSVPYFWIALLAVWFLGFKLRWFPLSGGYAPDATPGSIGYVLSVLHYGTLPVATIVLASAGSWLVGMRNMTVTTVSEDYVQLGRAKGLSPWRVMTRYGARNAILPSFTSFALALGSVVGGSLLTEMVFSYPGIGFLLFDAIDKRDYPLMQAVFLLVTLATLFTNFVADSLYTLLDPRTREVS